MNAERTGDEVLDLRGDDRGTVLVGRWARPPTVDQGRRSLNYGEARARHNHLYHSVSSLTMEGGPRGHRPPISVYLPTKTVPLGDDRLRRQF